jgi:hypothetical protein
MAFEEEFGCQIPDDAVERILAIRFAVRVWRPGRPDRLCRLAHRGPRRCAAGADGLPDDLGSGSRLLKTPQAIKESVLNNGWERQLMGATVRRRQFLLGHGGQARAR